MDESKALEALFPGPRRPIFTALFGEPERWWSLPELAGRAGLQTGSLRPYINHLRDSALIRERHDDGHMLLQPDPTSPVYAELHAIVAKLTARTHGGETILVVEDQPATAQITRILLESWGYRVLEAHGGAEALDVFENHREQIQLVLSDVLMPEMSGPHLARELQRRRPDLRVIFMSGYPNDELIQRETAFLPKPFNPASLSRIIRKELDRRSAA